MKHSPADDRGAAWLRASRKVGRRADHGVGRRPSRQATSRGGARQDRGPRSRGRNHRAFRQGWGSPGMPRNQGEYVASVAGGHGSVAEQVAADRRLVAAVVVPLRLMGLSCPVPDDAESARVSPSFLRPASVTAVHNLITAPPRSGTSDASSQIASVSSDRSETVRGGRTPLEHLIVGVRLKQTLEPLTCQEIVSFSARRSHGD
jgi:hypothetical protein